MKKLDIIFLLYSILFYLRFTNNQDKFTYPKKESTVTNKCASLADLL